MYSCLHLHIHVPSVQLHYFNWLELGKGFYAYLRFIWTTMYVHVTLMQLGSSIWLTLLAGLKLILYGENSLPEANLVHTDIKGQFCF